MQTSTAMLGDTPGTQADLQADPIEFRQP